MEKRCKVCHLREDDPELYEELFSGKYSLRQQQKMARDKGWNISYSSFRRHIVAGMRHDDS